jgi:hypothetical protein
MGTGKPQAPGDFRFWYDDQRTRSRSRNTAVRVGHAVQTPLKVRTYTRTSSETSSDGNTVSRRISSTLGYRRFAPADPLNTDDLLATMLDKEPGPVHPGCTGTGADRVASRRPDLLGGFA